VQTRFTKRKGAALLATVGLTAGVVGVLGTTGAGAAGGPTTNGPAANTQQSDCTSSNAAGGTRTLTFVTTLSGSASDTNVYPKGATVGYSGALVVTIPGAVVAATQAGSAAQGVSVTAIGINDEGVSVAASSTVSGGFSMAATGPQLQAPDPVNGNTFIIPVSGSVVSNGADGGTVNFTQGALKIGFDLTVSVPLNLPFTNASCVANNQNGVVDAGEASVPDALGNPTTTPAEFGLPYPAAPSATTALVRTNPTVTATSATVSSAAATSQIQVPIAVAVPQAPGGTPAAITSVTVTPLSAVGSAIVSPTGLVTYTPPNNTFQAPETFTVAVTDALGGTASATLTLDVKAGDATSALVNLTVNPGSLIIPACGGNVAAQAAPCPAITMSSITLNGKKQTSTGQIGQVTVIDARGLPLTWALSAKLAGPLQNTTIPGGSSASDGNNRIEMNQMTMLGQACAVDVANGGGGLYSATTPGVTGTLNNSVTVCQAAIGAAGGTFLANANLSLNVNPDVYVGSYQGTINFLLS
jgi:hypothetical protein